MYQTLEKLFCCSPELCGTNSTLTPNFDENCQNLTPMTTMAASELSPSFFDAIEDVSPDQPSSTLLLTLLLTHQALKTVLQLANNVYFLPKLTTETTTTRTSRDCTIIRWFSTCIWSKTKNWRKVMVTLIVLLLN
jgi:hypothetical protein